MANVYKSKQINKNILFKTIQALMLNMNSLQLHKLLQYLNIQAHVTEKISFSFMSCLYNYEPSITLTPCKGIRSPESRKFLLVESGILGFGIRNPAPGIRNPANDWNPEFKLLKFLYNLLKEIS